MIIISLLPYLESILADHTNGHAYATVLRPSVLCRLSSVTYALWLNGASYRNLSEEANRKWPMGNRFVM